MNHQDFALLAGSFADAFTSGHIKWLGAGLGFIFGNHPVYFVHVGSCRIVFKKRGLGWTQIAFSIGQSSDGSFFTGARICSTVWFRAPPSFATIDLGGWDQQAPSQPLPPDTVRRTSAPRVPKRVADEHIGSFRSGVGQERVQFINGVSRLAGDRY